MGFTPSSADRRSVGPFVAVVDLVDGGGEVVAVDVASLWSADCSGEGGAAGVGGTVGGFEAEGAVAVAFDGDGCVVPAAGGVAAGGAFAEEVGEVGGWFDDGCAGTLVDLCVDAAESLGELVSGGGRAVVRGELPGCGVGADIGLVVLAFEVLDVAAGVFDAVGVASALP